MSVILINPFEVPEGKEEEAIKGWDDAATYLRKQPGFISTKLHKTITPNSKFHLVNVAEWETPEAFMNAVNTDEFKKVTQKMVEDFPHYPALYDVIRT